MEVTQAQGLAPGRYFIPATFPSLLSTNQTVTNPLDRKIQSSRNAPWPPGARTPADKEQNTNQSQVLPDGARSHPPSPCAIQPTTRLQPVRPPKDAPPDSISPSPAGPSPWVWPVRWLPSGGREHPGGLTGRRADGQVDGWRGGITQPHLGKCCSVYYGLGIRHGTQAGYGPSQAGAL